MDPSLMPHSYVHVVEWLVSELMGGYSQWRGEY